MAPRRPIPKKCHRAEAATRSVACSWSKSDLETLPGPNRAELRGVGREAVPRRLRSAQAQPRPRRCNDANETVGGRSRGACRHQDRQRDDRKNVMTHLRMLPDDSQFAQAVKNVCAPCFMRDRRAAKKKVFAVRSGSSQRLTWPSKLAGCRIVRRRAVRRFLHTDPVSGGSANTYD